jgi:hypothetical protein
VIVLTPAPGRDYTTSEAASAALKAGHEFRLRGTDTVANKFTLRKETQVAILYNRLARRVFVRL